MIHILFLFALLISSNASVNDFCVADLKYPDTPSGYPCKSPTNVTVDDFVFSGFHIEGNTTNIFKVGFTTAFVTDFPGVNGLGISAARIDVGENGSVPMHTHPGANEIVIIVKGQLTAGFITPTALYVKKTLKPGDIIIFPQGQLHFLVNSGVGKATAFSAYSSPNPGVQLLDLLLFDNSLPSEIVAKTTLIGVSEIKKLKALFGGSG
ncbi:RmlC-like cupin domain superfamily [Sesbania bispinosa]|nr:RmlC-like cupin domain superfamily [Sesbania bispinosa]